MPLTPSERVLRARIGGHAVQAKYGPHTIAARARKGLLDKFERQAREQFPDLPEQEILARAEQLKKAHFTRLSLKAAVKRRKARELAEQADAIAAELATLDDRGPAA